MDVATEKKPANNVWITDKAFYMPQLNRYRRIWLYIPPEYGTSRKRYPVLYMQDGQNLFEEWSAFGEEWGVDETLNRTKEKCIVVGVDNGVERRMNEYTLYDDEIYGRGEGVRYLSFMVKTLKPYIDKTYRTLADRDYTFVAGSSLGGLISFYACLHYPQVFGGAGIFSPAFWIAPGLLKETQSRAERSRHLPQRFYFYYGEREGHEMAAKARPVIDLLKRYEHCTVKTVTDKEGTHSEAEWRKEFPRFYKWIISNGQPTAESQKRRG